ncbi:MAG: DUF695 domain-containing protein [Muribaculaceae bacterium]
MPEIGEWWTAPAVADDGRDMMVSGRSDVATFRRNPKFKIRIEIVWAYDALPNGMPCDADAEIMGQATDNLLEILHKDPVAVMTGIFTGAGERTWVFYTLSTNIFQKKLNEALADLPLLPLQISAENDPDWEAYQEMAEFEVF